MSDTMKEKIKKIFKDYIPYVLIIIFVILFKQYVIAPVMVSGDSMNKTLLSKDIMILNIIDYKLNGLDRFDIVVIDNDEEYIIKRIIGLPGDKVTMKNNELFINNKKTIDKYAYGSTEDFSVKVPKNSYFVLGDNRENSLDSRYFGFFRSNKIKGKTSLTIYPFKRFGNK